MILSESPGRTSLFLSILFIFFACQKNEAENDSPENTDCGCSIVLNGDVSCADTLANLCSESNLIFSGDLCQCICQNQGCGSDCMNSHDQPCVNGTITTDCDCICDEGFFGPSCDIQISPGEAILAATIELSDGSEVNYTAADVDYSFSNSAIVLEGYNDSEDSFIYIEMTDIANLSTGVSYQISGSKRIATVRILEFNGEVWSNIPGVDPGYVFLNNLNITQGTFSAEFEFPISNGSETAWVRNGVAARSQ